MNNVNAASVRKAKILLYRELLDCSDDHLLSEDGENDLNLMGLLARDRDIQDVLRAAIQRDAEMGK